MSAPLSSVVVLDLTSVVAGPLATRILAQQGARVIKVEPASGDTARTLGAQRERLSGSFLTLNGGKESVVLDLTATSGLAALFDLAAGADVMIHNYRPGVMEKLGVTVEALRARRPDIIVARISGFGETGPMAADRAYDPVIQAESGMAGRNDDGEPRLAAQYLCDKVTGLYAAQAVTAALAGRAADGRARVVDISMLEAAAAFGAIDMHSALAFQEPASPMPNVAAIYRPWRTADGWVVVIMLTNAEFAAFSRALDLPDLLSDARFKDMPSRFAHWDALRALAAPRAETLPADALIAALRREGVPCARVNDGPALHSHPQLAATGFWREEDHPAVGRLRLPSAVARFDGDRGPPGAPAPTLGQHTGQHLKA